MAPAATAVVAFVASMQATKMLTASNTLKMLQPQPQQ